MRLVKYLLLALIISLPLTMESFAGPPVNRIAGYAETDTFSTTSSERHNQLSAYYDLRARQTHIQITNVGLNSVNIHVQIFQHDSNCDELNFFDELTPNDTVVYNLDNLIKNDGSEAPISLQEDSYGYVVITDSAFNGFGGVSGIVGNFRIIDETGYEYRSNMVTTPRSSPAGDIDITTGNLIANFNTIDGSNWADVVGYAYEGEQGFGSSVTNIDEGFSFDIFVFDMDEEPLSCDRRNFACGNVMNYGINEDYPNSRDQALLCPGGGLANPQGGFVSFENGANLDITNNDGSDVFVGFIGLNNANGTGSLDSWFYREGFTEFSED